MKNRKLILIVSLVLALTMSLGGTLAYLTDTDADVNTMVLGNVSIEQNEYQRVVENGTYKTDTIDNQTSYVLEAFENNKVLLPTTEMKDGEVYNFGAGDYDGTYVRMSQVDSQGGAQVFQSPLAVDKFVTVKNTGKTDAYVRTLIAYELGEIAEANFGNVVRTSAFMTDQKVWTVTEIGTVEIDGNKYVVDEFIYNGGAHLGGVHEAGILPAGETTYPSLCQVYMTSAATNEDVVALDGNGNGTYDILVLSQAIQAAGWNDAKTALDTGFGEATVANVQSWFGGLEIPTNVATAEELAAALAEGGTVVLTADITTDTITIKNGKEATINLNGKTLTATAQSETRTNYALDNYGTLTLTGNGTIEARGVENFGTMIVEDGVKIVSKDANGGSAIWNEGHLTINGGIFTTANLTANDKGPAALTNNGGTVVVNNGTFDGESPRCYAVLNNGGKMTINNATVTGKHGAVGVSGGEVIINGGSYICEGVAGQSDHAVYCGAGTITINAGTIENKDLDAGGKHIWVETGATVVDNRASN